MAKNTSAEKAAAAMHTPRPMRMLPVLETTAVTAGAAAAAAAEGAAAAPAAVLVAGALRLPRRGGHAARSCFPLMTDVQRDTAGCVLQQQRRRISMSPVAAHDPNRCDVICIALGLT